MQNTLQSVVSLLAIIEAQQQTSVKTKAPTNIGAKTVSRNAPLGTGHGFPAFPGCECHHSWLLDYSNTISFRYKQDICMSTTLADQKMDLAIV